jgi:hypothetical protein
MNMKRKTVTMSLGTHTIKILKTNMKRTGMPMSRQIDIAINGKKTGGDILWG